MKVLLLPVNIASVSAITAEALNAINGVEAKSIIQDLNKYNSSNVFTVYLPKNVSRRKPIAWLIAKLFYKARLRRLIKQADVLHYFWSPALDDGTDLRWAQKMGKAIFVEWLGSDIRDPDTLKKINPFFNQALEDGYEYKDIESREKSIAHQQIFARFRAIPILSPEMTLYLRPDLFTSFHLVFQRINCKDFKPLYPNPEKKIPLIVHSPTAVITKGTNIILRVIEELQNKYEFHFVLLTNLSREVVLKRMQEADIFLDQLIIGGYGMAALEAMSFGKPVMTYLMPEVFKHGLPKECPIVNTSPSNLKDQLIRLITNSELRREIGVQSRIYVETYHNADKLARQLTDIYNTSVNKTRL
jgi:hypothetical protein